MWKVFIYRLKDKIGKIKINGLSEQSRVIIRKQTLHILFNPDIDVLDNKTGVVPYMQTIYFLNTCRKRTF